MPTTINKLPHNLYNTIYPPPWFIQLDEQISSLHQLTRPTAGRTKHSKLMGDTVCPQPRFKNIWDSTKGYRGEGPSTTSTNAENNSNGIPTGPSIQHKRKSVSTQGTTKFKPGENRTKRADGTGAPLLQQWGQRTVRALGAFTSTGHNMFMNATDHQSDLTWDKLIGCIAHLNIGGWGPNRMLNRRATWQQLSEMRTMVAAIIDHRKTKGQTMHLEYEINKEWIGTTKRGRTARWVHAPAKNNKIGGIALGIHPALNRYAHKEIHDNRGWGRWVGIELRGKKNNNRSGHIVIIATYGPSGPTDSSGSMWQYQLSQMDKLHNDERASNPRDQYLEDIESMINTYRQKGAEIILTGDINININNNKAGSVEWQRIMARNGLFNWMKALWPNITQIRTWCNKGQPNNHDSWIDHLWVSQTITRDGILRKSGIEQIGGIHSSDHSLIAAEIDWSTLLGRTETCHERHQPRPRTLMATNKKHRSMYQTIILDREIARDKHQHESMLSMRVEKLYARAKAHRRSGSVEQRTKMQRDMDAIMEDVTNEMLAAEEQLRTALAPMEGTNARQHWSPWMANKMRIIRLLIQLIRSARNKNKRWQVKTILRTIWEANDEGLAHISAIKSCPDVNDTRRRWNKWIKSAERAMKKIQKHTNARHRVQQRRAINKAVNKREEQATLSKSLKKFLNYALKRSQHTPRPTTLIQNDSTGVTIHDTPEAIASVERKITAEHMGKGRKRWYLNESGEIMPEFANTEYGKQWRAKLAAGSLNNMEWQCIPSELRTVFRHARTVNNSSGVQMKPSMYGNIFITDVSMKMLKRYITKKKKNTAPGESGIRIDHIAALPDGHKEMIRQLLSIVYLTGLGYTKWRREIVNWIPKEEGNPALDKRRPLMYYEVMRKMCIGVKKQQVLKVWMHNGAIDKDNYAFMPGLDTSDPLMIKKMVMEDAQYFDKSLTLIDIDFSKAYDSTEMFAKDISLRRVGMPQEGLDLWQMYDDNREMIIETAYGITDPISPECGAWGQGAEESPMGWLMLMSWLSAHVNTCTTKPYKYAVDHNQTLAVRKTIYADDGNYFSAGRDSSKSQADGISHFCTSTGIIVKPTKSYAYSNESGEPIMITTYEGDGNYNLGNPCQTPLKELGEKEYWRHLGNIQNSVGDTTINTITMHDGSVQENISDKVKKNVNALVNRKISYKAASVAVSTVIIPQIMYPATYNNMTQEEINKLQVHVRKIFRTKMKGYVSKLPNDIIHGHKDLGGLHVDMLEDLINAHKLKILEKFLKSNNMTHHIALGAIYRLQHYAKTGHNPMQIPVTEYTTTTNNMWLYILKQWMEKHEIQFRHHDTHKKHANLQYTVNGSLLNRCMHDVAIIDTIDHKRVKSEVWQWLNKYNVYMMSDIIRPDSTIRTIGDPDKINGLKQSVNAHKNKLQRYFRNDIPYNNTMVVQLLRPVHSVRTTSHTRSADEIVIQSLQFLPDCDTHNVRLTNKYIYRTAPPRQYGIVIRSNNEHVRVETIKQCGKQYKRTGIMRRWKCHKIQEHVYTQNRNYIKIHGQKRNVTTYRAPTRRPVTIHPVKNLTNGEITADGDSWISSRRHCENCNIVGCSDGSVYHHKHAGGYAWGLYEREESNLHAIGITGYGKERHDNIETHSIHSYRVEALALLAALAFLRNRKWKGRIEWHMDWTHFAE